jgi:hypothetical protein
MCGQNVEVIDKLKNVRITLENIGAWRKQKVSIKAKSNQASTAIEVRTLEIIGYMKCCVNPRQCTVLNCWD